MKLEPVRLQDPFLNQLRKQRVPVSVYLANGIKLRGIVESFDQYVIILKSEKDQMIYKHAISTVLPEGKFEFGQHSLRPAA